MADAAQPVATTRRERIVEAALEAFAEKGFRGASTSANRAANRSIAARRSAFMRMNGRSVTMYE